MTMTAARLEELGTLPPPDLKDLHNCAANNEQRRCIFEAESICEAWPELLAALKAAESELARYKAVYTAAEALNFTEFAHDGRYTIDANPEALDALGVALAAKESGDGK